MKKALNVVSVEDAKKKVSDIEVVGNGDLFQLICKASSKEQGWMKSTKAMEVEGGCVVQVSTQQFNHVSEAVCFVPNVRIKENEKGKYLGGVGDTELNFRSKTEELLYSVIKQSNMSIIQPNKALTTEDNKRFLPDFYIKEMDLYIDICGCFSEDYNRVVNENYIVLSVEDVSSIEKYSSIGVVEFLTKRLEK